MLSADKKNMFKEKARLTMRTLLPKKENAIYLLISFIIAVFMWYAIIGREQIEAQYDIRLDYKSLDSNLVVREGLENKMTVRLRGPSQLFKMLNERDLTYTVNLSQVGKGATVVPLVANEKTELRAFEILEVVPPQLVIIADNLIEKQVSLEPLMISSPLTEDLEVTNIQISPAQVLAKGAESLVESLNRLLVPFNPGLNPVAGNHTESVAIVVPAHVEATPPVAKVTYTISKPIAELTLQRVVFATGENAATYKINPTKVEMQVSVPIAKAKDSEYLAKIRAVVEPSGLSNETAQVSIEAPQDVILLKVSPQTVILSR